ncbi:hypothetical protein QVD17_26354 [Tagetes erecta]|uniref:Uncharacterized protein n=1 Tax=Tagetes erecta TaxID=13708 RepID=A0AAD8NQ12_TARER|nr:hypothetical protein QVD17_26354 [Tagetes erecta]
MVKRSEPLKSSINERDIEHKSIRFAKLNPSPNLIASKQASSNTNPHPSLDFLSPSLSPKITLTSPLHYIYIYTYTHIYNITDSGA